MSIDLAGHFAAGGSFERALEGWRVRSQQLEFAQAVLEAIESSGVLIAEAGTGTGKTFAYLAPALIAGGRVIVSTGTKTLQDQLFHRDLPLVREKIGPVADFKKVVVVERLPKTRSGKILRGTMKAIADGKQYKIPATIDDPAILAEIEAALQRLGYARAEAAE